MTLIERLDAATGPDRELDAEIAKTIGWSTFIFGGAGLCWKDPAGHVRAEQPHFTGSLDATMTLMPKINRPNFPWLAIKSNNPNNPIGCRCELWLDNVKNYNGRGETLAIAICIAALKAREANNEN